MASPSASDPHLPIRRAQQRREAIELGRSGAPVAVIAKQLKMPLFVVRVVLQRAKITPILTSPVATTVTTAPAARPPQERLPRQAKAKRGRPPLPPLTPEQADRILSSFTEYNGYDEIASAVGAPKSQVRGLLAGIKPQRLAAWRTLIRMRRHLT
jgi:DNA invertase Pin-like site-specific DNA recombinase